MGEEKKEEDKKEESKEEKKEEEIPEIVLKVDMHCEACARKVVKVLKGFEGVEKVIADSKASKVVVKGKTADPIKVYERVQKKSGRKVELISPLPKPAEEEKKEENKEKKEEPPPAVTVVLKAWMHCDACAQNLQKHIRKIKGVESVETDLGNDQVIVKGVFDPTKIVKDVYKKTRKQVSIVKDEEKKVEEKKEEEKKEEKEEEKSKDQGEDGKGDDDKIIQRNEYYPSTSYLEYYTYPQIFSDENPNGCSVM